MSKKRLSTKHMTQVPTYHEVALGMMKATDPFSGKYPNITNSLSTKAP